MAEKALVDTNIWIDLFNRKRFQDRFLNLNRQSRVLVSVVTVNELLRGCHEATSLSIVEDFLKIVGDQLITPTEPEWLECARISERLLKGKKKTKQDVLLLQNDALIALAARNAGATLVTSDLKDFKLLKDFVRVSVDFWN